LCQSFLTAHSASIAQSLCLSVIGDKGFVLAGKLRRNPRPRVSFAPLKSLRSVFSFLAAGISVRGAHSASLASAHQFDIQ
jgi:hypothetical protein